MNKEDFEALLAMEQDDRAIDEGSISAGNPGCIIKFMELEAERLETKDVRDSSAADATGFPI